VLRGKKDEPLTQTKRNFTIKKTNDDDHDDNGNAWFLPCRQTEGDGCFSSSGCLLC